MKKSVILSMLAISTILLAACNQSENEKDSTADSSMSSSTKMSTTKESSSIEESSSSEVKTSSSPSMESSGNNTTPTTESVAQADAPAQQADSVLNQLAEYFPEPLPDAILTSQSGQYLSAATTSTNNQQNFHILYYAEDHAVTVNAPEVNSLAPIASFEKTTYNSVAEAQQAVGKRIAEDGVNTVNLGYGITGYEQGTAGSSYLSWKEGNWTMSVQASNVEGEEPIALSKAVVNYLEKASLLTRKLI